MSGPSRRGKSSIHTTRVGGTVSAERKPRIYDAIPGASAIKAGAAEGERYIWRKEESQSRLQVNQFNWGRRNESFFIIVRGRPRGFAATYSAWRLTADQLAGERHGRELVVILPNSPSSAINPTDV